MAHGRTAARSATASSPISSAAPQALDHRSGAEITVWCSNGHHRFGGHMIFLGSRGPAYYRTSRSGERPVSAHLARCRASRRRPVDRTDSSHSTETAATALHATGKGSPRRTLSYTRLIRARTIASATLNGVAPVSAARRSTSRVMAPMRATAASTASGRSSILS